MSFLKKSDGQNVQRKTEHTSGGDNSVFPEGTVAICACETAEWKAPSDRELDENADAQDRIGLMWRVQGGDFDNRAGFQTVRVLDEDEKQRDKALEWYAALDTILNEGLLLEMGEEPSDRDLEKAWLGKRAEITWGIWYNGKGASRTPGGNYPKHIVAVGDSAPAAGSGGRRRRSTEAAEPAAEEQPRRRRTRA